MKESEKPKKAVEEGKVVLMCNLSITISDEEHKIFREICYDEGKTTVELAERLLKTAIEEMAVENKDLIISTKEEVVVAEGSDGILITKLVRTEH